MALICPYCKAQHNPCPDFSIYYVENRAYNTKVVQVPTRPGHFMHVAVGDAYELDVVEYVMQECSSCHKLMIIEEQKHTALRAKDEEDQ